MSDVVIEDLDLYQGDDIVIPIEVELEPEDGVLSDYRFNMQIRRKPGAPVLVDLSSDNGDIVTKGNIIQVVISKDKSSVLSMTTAAYDLQATSPQGRVKTILYGTVNITNDITR
ncbi:hypothetical protein [Aggregatibacter kilianii]|uniref:hypothetical protein n=1 Tax=Aggregatibacter kilianii TaxID=2025884 RepID=UPI000D647FA3|nr:hypothetical protein [Aggregatibacter kilianii]